MAKKEQREVTDPNEAFARLGINEQVTDPEGNVVTTAQNEPSEQVQPTQPAETVTTEEPAIQLDEEPEEAQEQPAEVPAEEQQRRSWQAEADKAKAELEKSQEQMRLLQAQNQQLLGVVTPFMQKYGGEQPQAQAPETNGEPEPDFIEDGYFDPKKFADYQRKERAWLRSQLRQEVSTDFKQQREQETLQQQLSSLAQEFPEYVNPLTGQVDTERVHRDLQAYTSKKTVVDLIREAKGIKPKAETDPLQQSLSAIEKNADRPQPVTASRETEKEKKTVPKRLKELHDVYGEIELPEDFDGLID
jgi:hypothetical protein